MFNFSFHFSTSINTQLAMKMGINPHNWCPLIVEEDENAMYVVIAKRQLDMVVIVNKLK